MATYYSYDEIYKINAWQDNNVRCVLTQGEGMSSTSTDANTYVKTIIFQLRDGQGAIPLPSSTTAISLALKKSDGSEVLVSAFYNYTDSATIKTEDRTNGIVYFAITQSMTDIVGDVVGEIRLTTTTGIIKFYGIKFYVYKGVSDDAVIHSDDFNHLVNALNKVEAVTVDGNTVIAPLDEVITQGGLNPAASGVIYDYLVGNYTKYASISPSDINTATDNQTIYYVNNTYEGHYNRVLCVKGTGSATQFRFTSSGQIFYRQASVSSGTVGSWGDWAPIGSRQNIQDKAVTKAKLGDDVIAELGDKMDLAPLNPTAEQIAAMSTGQLYGDTVNHKGVVKGGQSFYDTEYINTLSARAVQPANFLISHSNLHGYTDANSLDKNRVYAISADVTSSEFSNLPAAAYGVTSYLTYYAYMDSRNNGVQLLQTATDMWYRTVSGTGSGTWVQLTTSSVQPVNFLISHSNLHGCTNANSLDKNRIYAIAADVTSSDFANLPTAAYGELSYLTYYAYMDSRNHGVQLLQTATDMWYRTVSGTGSGTWVKIADVETVASDIASAINTFASKAVKSYGATITHDNLHGFTGANSLTQNNIYVIAGTVTSTEFTDLPSAAYGSTIYLLHYSYHPTKKNGVQICTTSSKMWFRHVSNSAFGDWVELASQIDQNPNVTIDDYFVNTCVFKPISLDNNTGLFIFGDSITTDAHGGFTWGSLVAAKTGCTEYNFGVSGSAFVGYTAHPHTVMEQINSVPSGNWANCDVCIVAAGTNDQKTENSAAGLRTAVQDVITAIKTNAPDAKIIFITPIRRESSGNNGLPMIAGAICNVALANECSVINGFDFPIPTHTNSWITELTDNDGLHPNVIGKKIYAQSVLNTLG